jgi:hypothetical protein
MPYWVSMITLLNLFPVIFFNVFSYSLIFPPSGGHLMTPISESSLSRITELSGSLAHTAQVKFTSVVSFMLPIKHVHDIGNESRGTFRNFSPSPFYSSVKLTL